MVYGANSDMPCMPCHTIPTPRCQQRIIHCGSEAALVVSFNKDMVRGRIKPSIHSVHTQPATIIVRAGVGKYGGGGGGGGGGARGTRR